jgi:hypothetical protein
VERGVALVIKCIAGLWVLGQDLSKQVNMSILAAQVGRGLLGEIIPIGDIYV